MKPSPQGRVLWVLLVLVCVGVAAYLALRHRLFSPVQPDLANPATHRTNLVLQAGSWRLSGTTNLFTGLLVDTYEAGSRKSLTPVSNGLLHGVSRGWYTNGQQQVEEHYSAGTSHGLRTKWHLNGQKLSEVTIVDGKLEGTFQRWDERGALTEEIEMKAGQPDGVSRSFYPSGSIKADALLKRGQLVENHQWKDGEKAPPEAQPAASKR